MGDRAHDRIEHGEGEPGDGTDRENLRRDRRALPDDGVAPPDGIREDELEPPRAASPTNARPTPPP